MFRFIHTADWQIGKQFGGFEVGDAVPLAEARIAGVRTIANLARTEAVDAVLVAGDVFDAQGVSDRTIRQAFQATAEFDGPWLLLPGNHDAALVESVWTRAQRLGAVPPNVHLCLTPQAVTLGRGEGRRVRVAPGAVAEAGTDASASEYTPPRAVILPAPLSQRNTFGDLTEWFAGYESPPGVLRIGLAHGSVQGLLPDTVDSANPIAPGRAAEARLDYLALGDWHGMLEIDTRCWYSGTHETDRFRSNDSGNALMVTLRDGQAPEIRAVRTGRYRWHAIEAELRLPSDVDELRQRLAGLGADDIAEVRVSGVATLETAQRLQQSVDEAQARLRALRLNRSALRTAPSEEEIATLGADGYVADVLNELRTLHASADAPGSGAQEAALAGEALALLATTLREARDAPACAPSVPGTRSMSAAPGVPPR